MTRKLKWPSVRKDIKISFSTLYDFELQKSWFDSNYKHAFWDSLLYYAFDHLYDVLDDVRHEIIGVSLYNKEEQDFIEDFLDFFDDEFEGDKPDKYYVNHPSWPKFTEAAKQIVAMMEENEKKYDFASDLADYYRELDEETPEDLRKKGVWWWGNN